jgi:hypothetical protein|tara:strand:+ start:742 stop:1137 length:396 start_codon:yes stop_codon:yes gene_type:complete
MVSLDDFPTTNEVLEENQKTRDRSPTIKFLEKFPQFSVEKGNKGIQKEFDYVLKYHGHKVTFDELAIMCAFMFWNEDSIYPRGILDKEEKRSLFKGGKMFQGLINSSMDLGFPTKEILKANKLDKSLAKKK